MNISRISVGKSASFGANCAKRSALALLAVGGTAAAAGVPPNALVCVCGVAENPVEAFPPKALGAAGAPKALPAFEDPPNALGWPNPPLLAPAPLGALLPAEPNADGWPNADVCPKPDNCPNAEPVDGDGAAPNAEVAGALLLLLFDAAPPPKAPKPPVLELAPKAEVD